MMPLANASGMHDERTALQMLPAAVPTLLGARRKVTIAMHAKILIKHCPAIRDAPEKIIYYVVRCGG